MKTKIFSVTSPKVFKIYSLCAGKVETENPLRKFCRSYASVLAFDHSKSFLRQVLQNFAKTISSKALNVVNLFYRRQSINKS